MNTIKTRSLNGLLLILFTCPVLWAQQDFPEQKAILCFDIRVDKIRESQFTKSLTEREFGDETLADVAVTALTKNWRFLPTSPKKFKRVFGMAGVPESLEEIRRRYGQGLENPFPGEFVMELEFIDKTAADSMLEGVDKGDPSEINGVSYYQRFSENGLEHLLVGKKSPTRVTFGTKSFISAAKPQSLFTAELSKLWSQQSKAPIRFSIEGETRSDLLAEFLDSLLENMPRGMRPVIHTFSNLRTLNLMIDPDADKMISVRTTATDEESGAEVRETINGLLGLSKLSGKQWAAEVQGETPIFASLIQTVCNDLQAAGKGREANIAIKKPKELVAALNELMDISAAKAKERLGIPSK